MGQHFSHEEACSVLKNELGIRKPFLAQETGDEDKSVQRIVCLVQQEWLATQMNSRGVSPQKCTADNFLLSEEQIVLLQPSPQHEINGWQRVSVTVIKKPLKKLKIKHQEIQDVEHCTLFDFLHLISTEDHANLDECMSRKFETETRNVSRDSDFLNDDTFSKMIQETYGMPVKRILTEDESLPMQEGSNANIRTNNLCEKQRHHFIPLLFACQSGNFIYLVESPPSFTLHDVLAFSPAVASNSAAKYMFLLYQVLKLFAHLQAEGFSVSPLLTFKDVYVTNSLWLSMSPFQVDDSNVIDEEQNKQVPIIEKWSIEAPDKLTPPFPLLENLHEYTLKWVNCELTTFDYILILNTLAGRRMKDPTHYPIFPWVMDFTKADGGFRDLTKSKYRLCKSDTQLDITYSHCPRGNTRKEVLAHVAHHISDDPLTAISYYVYLARCVPKDILCKHVRSRWVPDEYPSSMERLYSWTPEECIPEFYSDPLIFKSVHEDLADLILPSWAPNAEEFIKQHRAVLEGHYVSLNLNNWIDIIFGYKLSGLAAVDSKNVYLSLVDGHSHLTNSGVLQLFSRPHPVRKIQRLVGDCRTGKSDNCVDGTDDSNASVILEDPNTDLSNEEGVTCVSGKLLEEDVRVSKPAGIRRDIWSIDSAIDEATEIEDPKKNDEPEVDPRSRPSVMLLPPGLRMKIDTLLEGVSNEVKPPIVNDFKITGCSDFIGDLEAVEKELKFQCHIAPPGCTGVGKSEFGSVFDTKAKEKKSSSMETVTTSRNKDILILANVLIELALHDYVRLRTKKLNFEERINENFRLMKANLHRFPSWLISILESWIESSDQEDVVQDQKIAAFFKNPTLLLNHFINPFPCPKYFPSLHNILATLYSINVAADETSAVLNRRLNPKPIPTGNSVPSSSNIVRAAHLIPLVIEELDAEGIELLLTFVLPLFSNPATKLHAFLHIFHPLGTVMGVKNSLKSFYEELQRLYDNGTESNPIEGKLLDQGFISKVITVFGLHCFLECFMQFIIDGLIEKSDNGYYKEKNDTESFELENPGDESEIRENKAEDKGFDAQKINDEDGKEMSDRKTQQQGTEAHVNRKASILEDDDNINVLNPKSMPGKRLTRSGVFTRLESILENDRIRSEKDMQIDDTGENNSSNDSLFLKDESFKRTMSENGKMAGISEITNNKSFLSIVEKSEVIYDENDESCEKRFYEGDSLSQSDSDGENRPIVMRSESTEPFNEEKFKKEQNFGKFSSTDSQNSENSFAIISDGCADKKIERRSTLSEIIRNTTQVATEAQIPLTSQALVDDSNSFLPETQKGSLEQYDIDSIEEDHVAEIEDFSIDSMYSEDEGKSFLIRRSSVKIRGQSNNSPFMVLPSEEDINNDSSEADPGDLHNDNIFEEYTELPVNKLPDTDELEDISRIASVNGTEYAETSSSAEEFALASLNWITPWLGPVLATKYVVNPILKRMPKIWLSMKKLELTTDDLISNVKSKGKYLIDCLLGVVEIYGSAIVLDLFLPYASRAVNSALKANKVSGYGEGQLVSILSILSSSLVTLNAEILTDKMEALSQEVFEPLLRLLSSFKQFSTGSQVRSVLLHYLVGLLAALSQNLGQLDAREVMTPLLQRFFSCFDCVYRLDGKSGSNTVVIRKYSFLHDDYEEEMTDYLEENAVEDSVLDETIEAESACEDDSEVSKNINDLNLAETLSKSETGAEGNQANESYAETKPNKSIDSNNKDKIEDHSTKNVSQGFPSSATTQKESNSKASRNDTNLNESEQLSKQESKERKLYKDLYGSFTPALAHYSYVLFCRVLGDHFVASILYNEELIWQLCSNFDEGLTLTSNYEAFANDSAENAQKTISGKLKDEEKGKDGTQDHIKTFSRKRTISEHEEEKPVHRSSWQHIEGEWLQEWKENFDSKNDDGFLRFKGRRLQTYAGHSSAVRDIYIPDNEHYFLSASRDKSVKLWLLKNHGNGTAQIGCIKTYDKHTKGVFAVQSIESKRFAVSCDGTVHVWDPIECETISHVDLGKNNAVTSIRTLPVPNPTVAMATTEGTIRLYDVRQKSMSKEWKLVSSGAAGSVRCLCVNESGTWIAAGFSSGFISVLDLRTGILRGQWKAHESEILQIEPYSDHNFLSSSSDLRMKMWNEDGSLALRFKRPPDPVNCLTLCKDQCVWASTSGNRIGITHRIENGADYESKKLPQELFRGAISKLKVLPVHQLYLVGSENGNVVMFA